MLFLRILAKHHTWRPLLSDKRSLQPVGPSSFTRLGWFSLPTIDQYSSLLPPVGVWTVSQFQCGGPSSQNPYPSLMKSPCGNLISWGISPDFSGLSPCYRQIAYALLTRAPVAAKSIATLALPLDLHVLGLSLAFILSQDQTLRCIALFFSLYLRRSPGRNRRSLSIVLHLLLSNIFNDLRPSPNTGPKARSLGESVAKVHPFPAYLQIFYHLFFEKFST